MTSVVHDIPWIHAQLFKHLTVGVTIWHLGDPHDIATLRYVTANPAGEHLTGRAASACVGRGMDDVYGADLRETYGPAFLRAATSQIAVELNDVTYTLRTGEPVQLRVRLVPLGRGYVASVYANVTDQMAAMHDLAGRTEALERSNRELEEFAAVVSHDLREPLRKVVAFGGRLHRRAAGSLDERSEDYLHRMVGAAQRMQQLIDDLLTLSRVRATGRAFVMRPMATIVAEVLDDLEVLLEQTGGTVVVGALPRVLCDPTQMRQVVQNLVGNALKFHQPGEPPRVRIEQVPADEQGRAGFAVIDDGIGFEPRFAAQIFGVFQRLHGRSAYLGSGVGLAVCKRIVERHGGQIVVSSQLGKGARFVVYLPEHSSRLVTA